MGKSFIRLTVAQQLARKMQNQIETGAWKPGESIPSLRSLADRYGVSLNTTQKAMRELAAIGLIDHQPGLSGVVKSGKQRKLGVHKQVAWIEGHDPATRLNYWADEIMRGARSLLALAGFRVTIITYHTDQPDPWGQIMRLLEPIVDDVAGLFCPCVPLLNNAIEYAQKKTLPWMTLTPTKPSITHNFVTADNMGAGRMAGRCFAQMGLRRLAMLHIGMDEISPQNKATGLFQGYLEHGSPPPAMDLIHCRDQEEPAAYEAMRDYLKDHEPPEGLFTIGDWLAIGAIRACQEAHLRVPEEIGVISSTGIPANLIPFSPSLAAVAQPMREMGEQIGAALVQMIREGVPKVPGRTIPCHFVPGRSFNAPDVIQRQWAGDEELSIIHPIPAADAASHSFQPTEVQYASSELQTV
jgi:LacI family transcriptional regulator